jgi:hypothetical protein
MMHETLRNPAGIARSEVRRCGLPGGRAGVLGIALLLGAGCWSQQGGMTLEEAGAEALRAVASAGFDVAGVRAVPVRSRNPERNDPMFRVDPPGPKTFAVVVDRRLRKWTSIWEGDGEAARQSGTGRTGGYAITTEQDARRRLLAMAARLGAPDGCEIAGLTLNPRPGGQPGGGYATVAARIEGRVLGRPVFGRFYGMRVILDGFDGALAGANQSWSLPPLEAAPQRIDSERAVELALPDPAKRAAAERLGPVGARLGYLAAIDGRLVVEQTDGRPTLRKVPPMAVMRLAWEVTYLRRAGPNEPRQGVVRERAWVDAATGEVSREGP